MAITIDPERTRSVVEESGQNVYLCYQCKKCTSGCPMADHFDLTPAQLLRALQFGQLDTVLNSRTMWLCAYCETCVTRCPMEIDLPRIMDTLKAVAKERGIKPPDEIMSVFNETALAWINRAGRINDVMMMAEVNLRLRKPLHDAGLGFRMLRNGKIRFIPEWPGQPKTLPKPAAKHGNARRVGYFPGCSLHCTGSEYDESTKAVAKELDLELAELKNWTCCGSSMAHQVSRDLATEFPVKNLALAEAAGEAEITLPCAACYSRFKTAAHELASDSALRARVSAKLGYDYDGGVKIKNILDTFTERIGLDEIERRVIRRLEGMKVVCYYGCLITRPVQVTEASDAEYPMSIDRIVQRLGAKTIDWSYKTDCCGASLMITQTDKALGLVERILANAKAVGADAIVVACSSCHLNLDLRQKDIAQQLGKQYDIPIIYFTQLMGLAFGLTASELGLSKHFTKADGLLQQIGLS